MNEMSDRSFALVQIFVVHLRLRLRVEKERAEATCTRSGTVVLHPLSEKKQPRKKKAVSFRIYLDLV
jgi:hypothetical protein